MNNQPLVYFNLYRKIFFVEITTQYDMKEEEKRKVMSMLSKCETFISEEEKMAEINQLKHQIMSDSDAQTLLSMLEALGNSDRMLILYALKEKDRCVCELEIILDKTQPAVSHHLKKLEEANLIRGWKKGKFTHYSLVKSTFDSLISLLSSLKDSVENWFG
jgi:DNA-binding transcriptional ArsR family regulator